MARFIGTVRGRQGEDASRLGSQTSGVRTVANGWNAGVRVEARYDLETGRDSFEVYLTGGSNERMKDKLLLVVRSRGEVDPVEVEPTSWSKTAEAA